MRDFLVFIPLAIVYLSFRVTITPHIPVPDVSVLIVFFCATRRGSVEGVVLAFVLGYIDDIFSGAVVGSSSFALVIIYTVLHFLSRKFAFTDPIVRAVAVAIAYVIKEALVLLVLHFAEVKGGISLYMAAVAFVTALFSPLFMVLFERLSPSALMHPRKDEG